MSATDTAIALGQLKERFEQHREASQDNNKKLWRDVTALLNEYGELRDRISRYEDETFRRLDELEQWKTAIGIDADSVMAEARGAIEELRAATANPSLGKAAGR